MIIILKDGSTIKNVSVANIMPMDLDLAMLVLKDERGRKILPFPKLKDVLTIEDSTTCCRPECLSSYEHQEGCARIVS